MTDNEVKDCDLFDVSGKELMDFITDVCVAQNDPTIGAALVACNGKSFDMPVAQIRHRHLALPLCT